MQPLLLFFVDGGSAIDAGDPCWDLLLALRTEGERTIVVRTPQFSKCSNLFPPGADHAEVRGAHAALRYAPKEGVK